MDKKKILIAAISIAFVFLAVAFVIARPSTSNTPLYTLRMEQASSKMNFLPTEINEFIYAAEKGYELNYNVRGYCKGTTPLGTKPPLSCEEPTCGPSCDPTCPYTCDNPTCPETCPYTCEFTCWSTCITCSECVTYSEPECIPQQ